MADFMQFGKGAMNIVRDCADNLDRKAAAAFLMSQQSLVQNDAIDARKSGKTQDTKNESGKGNVSGALARLRAMTPK